MTNRYGLNAPPPCECETVQSLAQHPGSHIIYDAERKEYRFEINIGSAFKILPVQYCFLCGGTVSAEGKLPLDTAEEDEIRELKQRIYAIPDAIRLIGTPDEDITGVREPHGWMGTAIRFLVYRRRWKMFYVWVCEYDNGGIGFIYGPKPQGMDDL